MGSDKAFLEWEGETLLAHAMSLAGCVASEVRIVGEAGKFANFGPVVEDVYRGCGPLGAIHAALSSTLSELNLIMAIDLPFVEPGFLEYLVAQAQESRAVVTVPRAGGGLQPLCAVYRREFAGTAGQSLQQARNKMD